MSVFLQFRHLAHSFTPLSPNLYSCTFISMDEVQLNYGMINHTWTVQLVTLSSDSVLSTELTLPALTITELHKSYFYQYSIE